MTNHKGAWFERLMADYLKRVLYSQFIDRRVKTGRKDKGDIANVMTMNDRAVAVECKNCARVAVARWITEAEVERVNLGAIAGVVMYKRTGKGKPEDQLVIMTARDFASILKGERVE
jgi:hypothetical protein